MATTTSPRVEIFVDGSNFYNGLQQQFGNGRYDIVKLTHRIVGTRTLSRVNFYTGLVDPGRQAQAAQKQQSFLKYLAKQPIPIRIFARPMKYYAAWPAVPPQEKGVDARIVQDLILGAVDKSYDIAVLLSGDQDFIEVVQLLHSRFSVHLETYYPASRRHLFEAARSCFAHGEVIKKEFYESIC